VSRFGSVLVRFIKDVPVAQANTIACLVRL
jgi:hypothetical protein